ncbi:Zinc finger BED domain-containing protein [Melia azedarach]|nr:Zinc finger BED domain-containing protein [Melia azedarach]
MNIDMNHQHDVGISSRSCKGRKNQSKIWEEMTKFTGEDGRDFARCNLCNKVFDGSSKKGTTHLKNHLERCRRKRNNNGVEDADKSMDQTTNLTSSPVIEGKSVTDFIKSYFHEGGFLTSDWDPLVLKSRKVEILQVFEEEKKKLRTVFSELSCRFNLIIEDFDGWYVLKVRYIDNSWEPKMKIIGLHAEDKEADHKYQDLVNILRDSCLDLKIDGNIYSTIYQYYGDDNFERFVKGNYEDVIVEISSWFSQRDNSLPFVGFLFSPFALSLLHCYAKINLKFWLRSKFDGIIKCIDYVNSTTSNMHNFQSALDNAKSMGKKVNISDPFPKNARSLNDLVKAAGFKEALCELERIDFDFKSRSINLTEHWDEAAVICQYIQELQNSIDNLCNGGYTTPNQYFPEFCDLYMKILPPQRTQLDEATSSAIEKLASALEKYKLVLVITVVLDPRFKMDIVQLWYNKIYGHDADSYLKEIGDNFTGIYNKYYAKVSESNSEDATTSYLDVMGRPCKSSHNIFIPDKSSELERYLNESKVPSVEKFDILSWWRAYTPIYPTLARMARDFLALPIHVDELGKLAYRSHWIVDYIVDCKDLDDDIKSALTCLIEWLHEK